MNITINLCLHSWWPFSQNNTYMILTTIIWMKEQLHEKTVFKKSNQMKIDFLLGNNKDKKIRK